MKKFATHLCRFLWKLFKDFVWCGIVGLISFVTTLFTAVYLLLGALAILGGIPEMCGVPITGYWDHVWAGILMLGLVTVVGALCRGCYTLYRETALYARKTWAATRWRKGDIRGIIDEDALKDAPDIQDARWIKKAAVVRETRRDAVKRIT